MIWSLNEIDSMVRKAARGAGLSWGLAEEAGKAARWLSAHGIPGPHLAAELLTMIDDKPYRDLVPVVEDDKWTAPDGILCPLIVGPALCDHTPHSVNLGQTSYPVFLLASIASIARERCVCVRFNDVSFSLDHGQMTMSGEIASICAPMADSVSVLTGTSSEGRPVLISGGRHVFTETATILEIFAARTYAPATEASRNAGAGAGLQDND